SFFFSSRRRHTRFSRDWSSDVCSSDLGSSKVLTASTATTSTNVDDGAYVIANVYKGETYMRSFMDELQRQGIASGSFSHNGLNYVYLERYNNLSEARKNYLSDVKEKYQGAVCLLHIQHDSGVD